MLIEFTKTFPFYRKVILTLTQAIKEADSKDKPRVMLPDGRIGVIDHVKWDGVLGVRPIDSNGDYCLNTTLHWSLEERKRVPEEIAIHESNVVML